MHESAATTLLKVSFYKYNKPVYYKLSLFVDTLIGVEVIWLIIVHVEQWCNLTFLEMKISCSE
jgi:hypothetical protein